MDRKAFLKTCGVACLGAGYALSFLESCGTTRRLNAQIVDSDMVVPLTAFEYTKKGTLRHHKAIILQNDILQDPVCVFRAAAGDQYTALLMRCTHQGTQLQLFGDKFQCPAHGSEFDAGGHVQQGPAEADLRTFPTSIENQQLKISLR